MKSISILIPYEAVPAAIVDPRNLFTAVNQFLIEGGKEPVFLIQLVGVTQNIPIYSGTFSVNIDALLETIGQTDLIIIPALSGEIKAALDLNKALIPWIIQQYNNGAEVVSLCSGAFLLAATGLLNGRECSTNCIVSAVDGLYSSYGACSYWNLLLHMVEKYAGRELAIRAASFFAIETDRKSQSPFSLFNEQKQHDDESIRQAQEFIEKNVGEKLSIEDLAGRFAIGRRHFIRRFKKATNNTPLEYIQRVKIEAAKNELENTPLNITQVMYTVGYNDIKTFRTVFKKITGLLPVDYRNKYNRSAAA
jgi:transcriptional regulator GlxA family with amidase domain